MITTFDFFAILASLTLLVAIVLLVLGLISLDEDRATRRPYKRLSLLAFVIAIFFGFMALTTFEIQVIR